MKIFKQGQVVEEFVGLRDVKTLREALEKFA
jgi:thioredoxin-like negative regulator of GroEL